MFRDSLRDRITVQQATLTTDSGFGQTESWGAVISIRCRVTQLSGRIAVDLYGREASDEVYRVYCEDSIVHTDGETSLHKLMRKAGEAKFRFVWDGDRTITPIGMRKPAGGLSDHHAELTWFDCLETPEGRGYADS